MKKQNKTSVIISEEKDKKISTLSKSTIVTVALAADNNYAMPMGVTMTSILENAQKTTSYEFYLLVPSDFSQENKDKIIQLKNKYPCKLMKKYACFSRQAYFKVYNHLKLSQQRIGTLFIYILKANTIF